MHCGFFLVHRALRYALIALWIAPWLYLVHSAIKVHLIFIYRHCESRQAFKSETHLKNICYSKSVLTAPPFVYNEQYKFYFVRFLKKKIWKFLHFKLYKGYSFSNQFILALIKPKYDKVEFMVRPYFILFVLSPCIVINQYNTPASNSIKMRTSALA